MKCRTENKEYKERCPAMEKYLEDEANTNKKGFVLYVGTNIKTFESTCRGVVYKKFPKDTGCFLNYCPWCGGKISPE